MKKNIDSEFSKKHDSLIKLINNKQHLPEKDYETLILQKNTEIEQLRNAVIELQPDIKEECQKGHLHNVKLFFENQKMHEILMTREAPSIDELVCAACCNGHLPIVKYLFSKGANPHGNALQIASKFGYLNIVKYLVEMKNADVDNTGYNNSTPLHYACQEGHLEIVKYLYSRGANLEAKDGDGNTPLHKAASSDIEIVKFLLLKGANKHALNNEGKQPSEMAKTWSVQKILNL